MNRKDEIIEMTVDLIQTVGYSNFSFKDLSDKLGIAKASIHHHFAKKQDLGLAVCNKMVQIMTTVTERIDSSAKEPLEKLEMFFTMLATQWENCSKTCPIGSFQNDFNKLSEEMKAAVQQAEDIQFDFFTKILTQGRNNKTLHFSGEPEDQSLVIAFTLKGAIQSARLRDSEIINRTFKHLSLSLQA